MVLLRMEILIPDRSRVVEEVSGRSNDNRDLQIFSIGDIGGSDDFLSGTTGRTRTLVLGGGKWPRVKDMETVLAASPNPGLCPPPAVTSELSLSLRSQQGL